MSLARVAVMYYHLNQICHVSVYVAVSEISIFFLYTSKKSDMWFFLQVYTCVVKQGAAVHRPGTPTFD